MAAKGSGEAWPLQQRWWLTRPPWPGEAGRCAGKRRSRGQSLRRISDRRNRPHRSARPPPRSQPPLARHPLRSLPRDRRRHRAAEGCLHTDAEPFHHRGIRRRSARATPPEEEWRNREERRGPVQRALDAAAAERVYHEGPQPHGRRFAAAAGAEPNVTAQRLAVARRRRAPRRPRRSSAACERQRSPVAISSYSSFNPLRALKSMLSTAAAETFMRLAISV